MENRNGLVMDAALTRATGTAERDAALTMPDRRPRRHRIEEVFGWIQTESGFAKVKVRSLPKVEAVFTFAAVAYNLVRLPKLLAGAMA